MLQEGDLHGHGGEGPAVFVYQMESSGSWHEQLPGSANRFTYGQFGENFTVDGLSDAEAVHRRPLQDLRRFVRGDTAARPPN